MKKKICQMIPQDEKLCVWMTSGLIAYKLCTRDYLCEGCVFDQVIRNETPVAACPDHKEPAAAPASSASASLPQKTARFYHRCHCWVEVENPDEVRLGIDGILARLVSRVKTVSLPQAGEPVSRDHSFAHIIQERHILQLVSPLSGTVVSVNQLFKKAPERLVDDPWGDGWLVTVRPENLEHDLRTLMFGKKAIDWYYKKEDVLNKSSNSYLNSWHGTELGLTMQDGGERLTELADRLSPEQYEKIIEAVSRA